MIGFSKFIIVIVIYEIDLLESIAVKNTFEHQKKISNFPSILIYDNSRIAQKTPPGNVDYIHNPSNGGVAAAYNYAARLGQQNEKEWLILLDQDTDINEMYYENILHSINNCSDVKIFCPICYSANKIVSPTYFFLEKTFAPKRLRPGKTKSQYFTIINSGIAINILEFNNLGGYDIDLPLDFSDHYLFSKYKKANKYFGILPCKIDHNLSSSNKESFEKVFIRFRIYCSSGFIYAKKIKNKFSLLWVFFRTLRLCFKHSKFTFLTLFFRLLIRRNN